MTETLGDLFRKLGEDEEDLEDGIQVGDGLDACAKVEPLMGSPSQGVWQPSPATKAIAASYGYGGGVDLLFPMVTPKGRKIGFPFPTVRPGQLEGIDAVIDQFEAGNHVLFEAPTGYGKSPMEIGVASYFENAYLLIGRNDLVDQWERDFEHFSGIGFYKARHRFDCKLITNSTTGQPANCSSGKSACDHKRTEWNTIHQPGQSCPSCPYVVNRDIALSQKQTMMTLALGMTIFKYLSSHPAVSRRKLLVIDECSELESEIMRFFEFTLSVKTILRAVGKSVLMDQFFNKDDPFYTRWPKVMPEMRFEDAIIEHMRPSEEEEEILHSCLTWALDIAHIANAYQSRFKDNGSEHAKEVREICAGVIRQAKAMAAAFDDGIPYHAVISDDEHSENLFPDYTVKVKPLEARTLLEKMFSPFADHLLFVSATTGTASMFKATHGMKAPLVKVGMPSSFPVENRPVYAMPAGNMSKRTQEAEAPEVMKQMIKISQGHFPERPRFSHADQKGIIHTYNNKITDMVIEALKDAGMSRRMLVLRGGGRQRELVMDTFRKTGEPMILISPSAMLGLDLKEDLGRWQIIVKVPYANLGEPSVTYRKDAIYGWYEWQTAKDMIQTFGRIVRSNNDWGYTYILDAAFSRFYKGNQELFPDYIQQAIRFFD